jgi:nicotinate-nucleotide adenylyltransferase
MLAELSPAARGARRLGVLGGSFDPPHKGHLHAARAARDAFDLDHVLLVPAARPPHKPSRRLASAAERLAMLRLLAPSEGWLSVWSVELERDGPSYTVDTLRTLAQETTAELFLILGSDNLAGLPRWREAEAILALAQPIVILREGASLALGPEAERLAPTARARLAAGLCPTPAFPGSSSDVRRRLAAGRETGDLLPPALREFIQQRGIYREP